MDNKMHLDVAGKSGRVVVVTVPASKGPSPVMRTSRGAISRQRLTNGVCATIDPFKLTADALIAGDPELDFSFVASPLEDTMSAYFKPDVVGNPVPVGHFSQTEVVLDTLGQEKERRPYVPKSRNIDTTAPIKIARRIPLDKALAMFVFRHVHQLVHEDSLTFDFLFALAKDLHASGELALIGAGPKGATPLVVRERGTPYRAFLHGEIDQTGERYRLLMLLSDQELKLPSVA
jgi:hypothetical protein